MPLPAALPAAGRLLLPLLSRGPNMAGLSGGQLARQAPNLSRYLPGLGGSSGRAVPHWHHSRALPGQVEAATGTATKAGRAFHPHWHDPVAHAKKAAEAAAKAAKEASKISKEATKAAKAAGATPAVAKEAGQEAAEDFLRKWSAGTTVAGKTAGGATFNPTRAAATSTFSPFFMNLTERVVPAAAKAAAPAASSMPGLNFGNMMGLGILGFTAADLAGEGEETPAATEQDLAMALLLQQLQGANFNSVPQDTMMDPSESIMLRRNPRTELERINERVMGSQQYAQMDFMEELMQENAQLLSQLSQQSGAMSQFVNPLAVGARRF